MTIGIVADLWIAAPVAAESGSTCRRMRCG